MYVGMLLHMYYVVESICTCTSKVVLRSTYSCLPPTCNVPPGLYCVESTCTSKYLCLASPWNVLRYFRIIFYVHLELEAWPLASGQWLPRFYSEYFVYIVLPRYTYIVSTHMGAASSSFNIMISCPGVEWRTVHVPT